MLSLSLDALKIKFLEKIFFLALWYMDYSLLSFDLMRTYFYNKRQAPFSYSTTVMFFYESDAY